MKKTRIEVRYKKGMFDAVSERLKKDIADIGVKGLEELEYIEVYTLSGSLSGKTAIRVAAELLTDKVLQEYKIGNFTKTVAGAYQVEIAFNPGVMDPIEESAMKAVKDMGIKGLRAVNTTKKYVFYGSLRKKDVLFIADKLLYNKIIQHVVKSSDTEKKPGQYRYSDIEVPLLSLDDNGLKKLSRDGQLYMSLIEMRSIQAYFRSIKRNPTDCELETIAQTWSEHCKHKTMMGSVLYNGKKIKNLLKETVMKVTRDLNKKWCVSVFKDNAGIIEFDGKNNVCFKVETHNHPSALEPYGGAETGVGGVIRDILGTGKGARPIANTDVFCFGLPDMPLNSVPKGALHPKRVMKGVVSGVRDYGNKMGIPTVNGSVYFDERYTGNPLVFCGNVGIMPKNMCDKKVSPKDLIVVIGGRTGRDGIHGATFSSAELTHESETISSTAVQIGNPITEKKMVDTLLRARDMGLYEAITDCGAGGFSSAVGEMGEHTGADVFLDRAPLKYSGLKPWEIWVSEAQERMVLAVKPKNVKKLLAIFESENVEATILGEFTGSKNLRLFYKDHIVADVSMDFIHNGIPRITRKAVWKGRKETVAVPFKQNKDLTGELKELLGSLNISSKEWIIRQYDHEVQGTSVLKPLVGEHDDGPSDAAILRPVLESDKGIAISNGINPSYSDIDPYRMAASAIDEAMRQLVAVGCSPARVALLDNFCWGNTEKPDQLGGLVRASIACYDVAKVYGAPFISGKDSLNNEFNTGKGTVSIPQTLLISAIGILDDVRKSISMDVKVPGNFVYVLGRTYLEMGGSQYYRSKGLRGGVAPRVNPVAAIKLYTKLHTAINKGFVVSAHDVSDGGLGVALAEMFFAGGYGGEIALNKAPKDKSVKRDDCLLFSESNSRFVVEVSPKNATAFEKSMKGLPFAMIGKVDGHTKLEILGLDGRTVISSDIYDLKHAWKKTIGGMMHEEG